MRITPYRCRYTALCETGTTLVDDLPCCGLNSHRVLTGPLQRGSRVLQFPRWIMPWMDGTAQFTLCSRSPTTTCAIQACAGRALADSSGVRQQQHCLNIDAPLPQAYHTAVGSVVGACLPAQQHTPTHVIEPVDPTITRQHT